MADGTKIEWTDATWNPITGCAVVSPGCTNCYAMRLAGTRLQHHPSRAGLIRDSKAGPVWNGEVRFNEQWLDQPLRWATPRMIFVCAHGDLFAEGVPDEWIDRVFAVMALAPQHVFQVLTKRPERMRRYVANSVTARRIYEVVCDMVIIDNVPAVLLAPGFEDPGLKPKWPRVTLATWPLPNVWLGVSVEDQHRADERIPVLLDTPAAVRWISAEPLLGPVNFSGDPHRGGWDYLRGECDQGSVVDATHRLDWIVVGGESGPGARPMHPDWARSIRDQCAAAGVPFHFKQWGRYAPVYDRDREDPDWRNCGGLEHQLPNGRWLNLAGGHGFHGERVVYVDPVGKKAAGRTLDGRIHDGMPGERRAAA